MNSFVDSRLLLTTLYFLQSILSHCLCPHMHSEHFITIILYDIFIGLIFILFSGDVQNSIKCIYPNVIFTKLTYSTFEKEEEFPANLNLENKQNIEEDNSEDITRKTKLPSNPLGTDVDMASLEDSNKHPVNNGYFCRQVKFDDKTCIFFLKQIHWYVASFADALWAFHSKLSTKSVCVGG